MQLLDDVFSSGNYENIYYELRKREKQAKEVLLDFQQNYPNSLKEGNINDIIEQARRKAFVTT